MAHVPKKTGRPRSLPHAEGVDPVEEILAAAGRLFLELGLPATTMSRLAAEAGLKQSSLYYYFGSKDEVVAAVVARANVIPLDLVARVQREGGAPPVQLYRFVRGDVIALCELPFDINEVHRAAARQPEAFPSYWSERAELERDVAGIVRAGVAGGSLRSVDPSFAAVTIIANDEAVQNWYRLPVVRRDPHSAGTFLADLTVSGLLTGRSQLDSIRRQSDRLDALSGAESGRIDVSMNHR